MFDRTLLRLSGMRPTLVLTCVCVIVQAALIVGQAFSLSSALVGLWDGVTVGEVAFNIVVFFICFVMRRVVSSLQSAYLDRYAAARAAEFRDGLLGAIYDLGSTATRRHGSPALVSAAIEGIDDVEAYISLMVPKIVSLIIIPLVLVCVIFSLDWISGVIALVCFPCIILFMVLIGHTAQDESSKRYAEFLRMSNHFIDSLRGIGTLKSFGRSRGWASRVYAASERFRGLTLRTLRVAMLSSAVLDLFALLALAAVAIMLGFRLADGSFAFFPALAVLILVPEYFRPIRDFAADYHASLDGRNALASVMQIIEEGHAAQEPDGERGAHADGERAAHADGEDHAGEVHAEKHHGEEHHAGQVHHIKDRRADEAHPRGDGNHGGGECPSSGPCPHSLVFHQVSYAYEEDESDDSGENGKQDEPSTHGKQDEPGGSGEHKVHGGSGGHGEHEALSSISFELTGPCKIGIIGMSGAGKSTLMDLLAGFADPGDGHIAVDGIDVSTLRDPGWHARSAFISQDPYIFRMSLRDNVTLYYPEATDEQVDCALERAGLGGLANELDQGIDTVVGDGARMLSGGQMQRVALARAFIDEQRQILFFDEPTAHLDIETEMEIKENMLALMEGRLVFFATHRLHWVADMDYLIELDGGRIVWQGAAGAWPREKSKIAAVEGGA